MRKTTPWSIGKFGDLESDYFPVVDGPMTELSISGQDYCKIVVTRSDLGESCVITFDGLIRINASVFWKDIVARITVKKADNWSRELHSDLMKLYRTHVESSCRALFETDRSGMASAYIVFVEFNMGSDILLFCENLTLELRP